MKPSVINEFLVNYGTIVTECNEDVEIMMDDHICIKWEGIEYYIAENNSSYNDDDEMILEYLKNCCHV